MIGSCDSDESDVRKRISREDLETKDDLDDSTNSLSKKERRAPFDATSLRSHRTDGPTWTLGSDPDSVASSDHGASSSSAPEGEAGHLRFHSPGESISPSAFLLSIVSVRKENKRFPDHGGKDGRKTLERIPSSVSSYALIHTQYPTWSTGASVNLHPATELCPTEPTRPQRECAHCSASPWCTFPQGCVPGSWLRSPRPVPSRIADPQR